MVVEILVFGSCHAISHLSCVREPLCNVKKCNPTMPHRTGRSGLVSCCCMQRDQRHVPHPHGGLPSAQVGHKTSPGLQRDTVVFIPQTGRPVRGSSLLHVPHQLQGP